MFKKEGHRRCIGGDPPEIGRRRNRFRLLGVVAALPLSTQLSAAAGGPCLPLDTTNRADGSCKGPPLAACCSPPCPPTADTAGTSCGQCPLAPHPSPLTVRAMAAGGPRSSLTAMVPPSHSGRHQSFMKRGKGGEGIASSLRTGDNWFLPPGPAVQRFKKRASIFLPAC